MKQLARLGTGRVLLFFEWKLADFWVGAYWEQSRHRVDVWLCFLPCLPLHLVWYRRG